MDTVSAGKLTFLNLSREECQVINSKIIANGQSLLQIARYCSSQNNYGPGLSLTILGAEEYLKGIVLYFNGKGLNVFTIRELRGVLSNHKNRHEMASLLELLKLLNSIVEFSTVRDSLKAGSKKEFLSLLFKVAPKFLQQVHSSTQNISWWEKANFYKNRGLYSDFDGSLQLPSNIKKEDYNTANEIVRDMVNSFDEIKTIFEGMGPAQLEQTIEDINKGLAIMANNSQKSNKEKLNNSDDQN